MIDWDSICIAPHSLYPRRKGCLFATLLKCWRVKLVHTVAAGALWAGGQRCLVGRGNVEKKMEDSIWGGFVPYFKLPSALQLYMPLDKLSSVPV